MPRDPAGTVPVMGTRHRRGRGEGSVTQRADGRWEGRLIIGRTDTGRRICRSVYGATKREALEKLDAERLRSAAGEVTLASPQTVTDYLTDWLMGMARSIRTTTLARYELQVRRHVIPTMGGVRLSQLAPQHVDGLLAKEAREGASRRQLQMLYNILHKAFGEAVRRGVLARNPCTAISRPQVPRTRVEALEPAEVRALLTAAKGHRLEAIFWLAVTTGMRQGELFGLHWADVDLQRGSLGVRHSLQEVNGALTITETKTAKGRSIDLDAATAAVLRRHRDAMAAEGHSDGLVFLSPEGEMLRKSNFQRRVWAPLLQRAGVRRVRFHDLRHTAATLMLLKGVHPKVVQERLGHANISLTLDTYSHVLPSMQAEAVTRIGELLGELGIGLPPNGLKELPE